MVTSNAAATVCRVPGVLKFESHRGEILNIFALKKKRKKKELLRAPSVGSHNATRVDEGRKGRSLRDENARHEL